MCDFVSATMMAVSAATTLVGAAQQSQQAQQAAAQQSSRAWQAAYQTAYQTAQARNAATVSEYNAQDAERRGAVEEERQQRKTSLLLGTQQARFAPRAAIFWARRSTYWAIPPPLASRKRSARATRRRGRRGTSGSRQPTRMRRRISYQTRRFRRSPTMIRAWGSPGRCWVELPICSGSPINAICSPSSKGP